MKIKHKFREHLIFKYKHVDCGNHIREYQKFRLWFAIIILIGMIIASPFVVIVNWITGLKSLLTYPMGQNGYEDCIIYDKEVSENE